MSKASDAVNTARRVLQDYDADRFSDSEILEQVNGARRALAITQPDIYSTIVTVTLAAGYRQTVPTDCALFYEVQANRDSAGNLVKPVPTIIQREDMDRYQPGWQLQTAGPTENFMFDERFPGYFFVTPPAVAGSKADIAYAQVPADAVLNANLNAGEALLLDALSDYAIGRLLLQDAQSPVNMQRGMMHLSLFASATGSNLKALLATSPNTANEGGVQNKR